jgi:hypothetical protein
VRRDLNEIKHYEQAEGDCVLFDGYLEINGAPRLRDVRKGVAV